jgi:hypothetical protein
MHLENMASVCQGPNLNAAGANVKNEKGNRPGYDCTNCTILEMLQTSMTDVEFVYVVIKTNYMVFTNPISLDNSAIYPPFSTS